MTKAMYIDSNEIKTADGEKAVRSFLVGPTGADLTADGRLKVLASGSAATTTTGAESVTVGDSTGLVLASNAARISAVLVNDSDTTMYLGIGEAAVLNKGIRLNASGGSYEIGASNLFTGAINAICGSTGKTLCVVEF